MPTFLPAYPLPTDKSPHCQLGSCVTLMPHRMIGARATTSDLFSKLAAMRGSPGAWQPLPPHDADGLWHCTQ